MKDRECYLPPETRRQAMPTSSKRSRAITALYLSGILRHLLELRL